MKRRHALANALLWAAAIIGAAAFGAPTFFWLMLLPALAATSLLAQSHTCFDERATP